MVPMVDIGLEVALEALEVAPAAFLEELVLDVPEDLLGPRCSFGAVLIAHQHKRVGGERDGEYVGLDFGHLCDLAAIDHMLRYTLLPMTLDVEHFAKAKLMRGPTERPEEDGYSIVGDYLAGLSKKSLDIRVGEIRRLENDRCSGGLARKHAGACPARALAELVSFGSLIDFYRFCALRWGDAEGALPAEAGQGRQERLRALDGHRQRLRARDPERRQDPERGRLGARGDRPGQAREALEDAEREGPADNDDGLRLQGARKGKPQQGDVPRAGGRLRPQVGRAFGLVRPIGWLPLGARFPKQGV